MGPQSRCMPLKAKLITRAGFQTIMLPAEFRFSGKEVYLRRTKHGLLVTPADCSRNDIEKRRRRFLRLAGSCPNLPDVPRHTTPDLPRAL